MSTIHWLGHHLPEDNAESIPNYNHFWKTFLEKLSGTQPANRFHTLVEHRGL
jgi:hypothetical protein